MTAASLVVDLIGVAGFVALLYGLWLVYVPAAFIVGGLLCMAFAILKARDVVTTGQLRRERERLKAVP